MLLSLTPIDEAWSNHPSLLKKKKNKFTNKEFQKDFLSKETEIESPIVSENTNGLQLVITNAEILQKYKRYTPEYMVEKITEMLLLDSMNTTEETTDYTLLMAALLSFLIMDIFIRLRQ